MSLFSINNGIAKKIPSIKVGLERDIQKIFEGNLNEILNITFLATEYSTTDGRIDTLGIDNHGSPVIIEYKRRQNANVISQGLSYLPWLLDHRADFEVLVRKAKIDIKVDWSTPRVICVAESYNRHDLNTAKLPHIKIELWKFCIYQNDTLIVEPETRQKTNTPPSKVSKKDRGKKVTGKKEDIAEENRYTLDAHLSKANPETRILFGAINKKIIALDQSIYMEPKKLYIAYKLTSNFVDIAVQRSALRIYLLNVPSGKLNDTDNIARDLTKPKKIGHHGNYDIVLQRKEQINRVFKLIKQSYSYNKRLVKPEIQQKRMPRRAKKENTIKEKNRYTLDAHLSKANPETKILFEAINDKIVTLDKSIIIEPKKVYIAYKLTSNFADIAVKKTGGLKITLNVPSGKLNDPDNIARDLTKPKKIGHWGNGDYEVMLQRKEQINRVFRLIKQSYKYNKYKNG